MGTSFHLYIDFGGYANFTLIKFSIPFARTPNENCIGFVKYASIHGSLLELMVDRLLLRPKKDLLDIIKAFRYDSLTP